jgi:signal transduction histidine kinase
MLGQAIVSYEVFTGKSLPRRGFFRYWTNALVLCAGLAGLISWTLVRGVNPLYSLLTAALMVIGFYALFTWRSFAEREQFMQSVRPFVGSHRFIQQIASQDSSARSRAESIFKAMCEEVLNTNHAAIIPSGALSGLAGSPLIYPPHDKLPQQEIDLAALSGAGTPLVALKNDETLRPYRWAVALQAERGTIGTMLVGAKQDGGLYTEEEITTARAGAERIVDMLAGEEMARRLLDLQRRRLMENTIMDRRARRTLHDEVLPELHAALLQISALPRTDPAVENAIKALTGAHRQIADLIHNVSEASLPNRQKNIADAIRAMIDGEFKDEFDSVRWEVSGEPPVLDPLVAEVVYYAVREAVRNSALHGRDKSRNRPLNLAVQVACTTSLTITLDDDGLGLKAGPRHDEAPGSQGGLSLHQTMLAVVGGTMTVADRPEGGTRATISVPVARQAAAA